MALFTKVDRVFGPALDKLGSIVTTPLFRRGANVQRLLNQYPEYLAVATAFLLILVTNFH
jgi:hypothetical protein